VAETRDGHEWIDPEAAKQRLVELKTRRKGVEFCSTISGSNESLCGSSAVSAVIQKWI
jgi:hypothetical protein